jgi:hypothetical protein
VQFCIQCRVSNAFSKVVINSIRYSNNQFHKGTSTNNSFRKSHIKPAAVIPEALEPKKERDCRGEDKDKELERERFNIEPIFVMFAARGYFIFI